MVGRQCVNYMRWVPVGRIPRRRRTRQQRDQGLLVWALRDLNPDFLLARAERSFVGVQCPTATARASWQHARACAIVSARRVPDWGPAAGPLDVDELYERDAGR